MEKRSVTIISGFLGAGKTSIIRHWLETSPSPFALLINEFGACDVDGEILRCVQKEGVCDDDCPLITLENGCLCCTVAEDFVPAMTQLANMAHAPHHVVIETSGLSLPQPLIDAFRWEAIRHRFVMNGFIVVIDACSYGRGVYVDDPHGVEKQRREAMAHVTPIETLIQDQCDAADMVIINKADLVTMEAYQEVEGKVRERLGRDVPIIRCCHARCPWHVALGVDHSIHVENGTSHEDSHDHGIHDHDHDDHDHDAFRSVVCSLPKMASEAQALAHVHGILRRRDVYRVKGFIAVEAKERRLVIQAVGDRLQHYYDRPWREDEKRLSSLVVIGGRSLSETL